MPMKNSRILLAIQTLFGLSAIGMTRDISTNNPNIIYSPYNWVRGADYAQTPNPGAYFKLGFTGTSITVNIDATTLARANVPAAQYPLIRTTVDGGPGTVIQLKAGLQTIDCAVDLKPGNHTLKVEYVAGYVFLDFWTPVNVLKFTSFTIDDHANTTRLKPLARNILFLGDSITNGDDNVANFKDGITNSVQTQDATIGYPSVVAKALGAEYGIVAYGGASWDRTAADGHTSGLMTFWSMIDKEHSRLIETRDGRGLHPKFSPIPDEIYVNMGENRPPTPDQVYEIIDALVKASSFKTNIFIIVPFSGRARQPILRGYVRIAESYGRVPNIYLIDLGDNPYLPDNGPTKLSVDGQHPLAALHALLGDQIVKERARLLAKK